MKKLISISKVEEVSRPGGETLGKHRGVKVDFAMLWCFWSSPRKFFGILLNLMTTVDSIFDVFF